VTEGYVERENAAMIGVISEELSSSVEKITNFCRNRPMAETKLSSILVWDSETGRAPDLKAPVPWNLGFCDPVRNFHSLARPTSVHISDED
jgi:hypothetical protein